MPIFQDYRDLAACVRRAVASGSFDPERHDTILADLLGAYKAAEAADAASVRAHASRLAESVREAGFPEASPAAETRDWQPETLDDASDAEVCNSVLVMSGIVLDEIKRAYAAADTAV